MDRFIKYGYAEGKTDFTVMISMSVARMLRSEGADFEEFLNICIRDYVKRIVDFKNGVLEYDEVGTLDCKYKEHNFSFYNFENSIFIVSELSAEYEEFCKYLEELVEIDSLNDDGYFSKLYKKATDIVAEAHEGQTDKAGNPYIEYPIFVSEHLDGRAEKLVALLHDVVEDGEITVEDLSRDFPEIITEAVRAITRAKDELYASYIVRLRTNPIARRVKIEDMKHNMDMSRIPNPTIEDKRRVERYRHYLKILEEDYYYEEIATGDADPELRMVEYQIEGYEFHRAMRLIRNAEKDRLWKAIEVNNILKEFGAPVNVQIAALMYCCIEPEVSSIEGIANHFGMAVFGTYLGLPWNYDFPIEDKTDLMDEFLPKASKSQKLILLAITIAELREYEHLAYKFGQDGVFESIEEKLRAEEYYLVMSEGFDKFQTDEDLRPFYWMLQNLFKDVFVTYHVNKAQTELYQGCDLYCWVMKNHGDGKVEAWSECQVREFPESEFIQLTREAAEEMEDSWNAYIVEDGPWSAGEPCNK